MWRNLCWIWVCILINRRTKLWFKDTVNNTTWWRRNDSSSPWSKSIWFLISSGFSKIHHTNFEDEENQILRQYASFHLLNSILITPSYIIHKIKAWGFMETSLSIRRRYVVTTTTFFVFSRNVTTTFILFFDRTVDEDGYVPLNSLKIVFMHHYATNRDTHHPENNSTFFFLLLCIRRSLENLVISRSHGVASRKWCLDGHGQWFHWIYWK